MHTSAVPAAAPPAAGTARRAGPLLKTVCSGTGRSRCVAEVTSVAVPLSSAPSPDPAAGPSSTDRPE